jgi:peptidoglycan/xylan/chitin deacetylase (PgdA/CDA1 family)
MSKGVLLIGYDVERIPGRVPGEKWVGRRIPEDTSRVFLGKILRLHEELKVPATIFMVGCNIAQHVPELAACRDSGWFEIAQHTWSHYPIKTVVEDIPNGVFLPGLPVEKIEEQIARPVEELRKLLGVTCAGVTLPYCYYRGLADRPDILAFVRKHGLRYVRSYGRNERDYGPVSWDVQPFWYERQGFPEILEIPVQGWMDAQWRKEHGWENWPAYHSWLKGQISVAAERGLAWSHVQHDWTSLLEDESLEWTRRFLLAARENLECMTHEAFQRRMSREAGR